MNVVPGSSFRRRLAGWRVLIAFQVRTLLLCLLSVLWLTDVHGAGGTSVVAREGEAAHVPAGWPEGAGDLVNDPLRTTGLNSWFSEWPNDVNQYAYAVESSEGLNRLIAKLAAIKTDLRQIRLSPLSEPRGLGWVTRLPEGNGIPVIFSIGDQSRIDQWFKQVRKPFGVMEFVEAPVAVPPTLTLFVNHRVVDLEELEIPDGITVSAGSVPTVFHKFNTKLERQQEKEAGDAGAPGVDNTLNQNLDAASQAAQRKIEAFLASRTGETDTEE